MGDSTNKTVDQIMHFDYGALILAEYYLFIRVDYVNHYGRLIGISFQSILHIYIVAIKIVISGGNIFLAQINKIPTGVTSK